MIDLFLGLFAIALQSELENPWLWTVGFSLARVRTWLSQFHDEDCDCRS